MATGDSDDILSRLKSYTPRNWFGDWADAPIISAILTGISTVLAACYLLVVFAKAQTRLDTSSGGWVDIWVSDFLGTTLPRKPNESDASYIARAKIAIFQAKGTRPAMIGALTQLTGKAPVIFEPARPLDTGCMGASTGVASFCGVSRMGSLAVPYTALITVYRPTATGGSAGAVYTRSPAWSAMSAPLSHGYTGSLSAQTVSATDADIYVAINQVRPIATRIGVRITN